MLSKNDLETGYVYRVEGPDYSIAIWNGEMFIGTTAHDRFTLKESGHYEDGYPLGVTTPIAKLSNRPIPIYSINPHVITMLDAADIAVNSTKE